MHGLILTLAILAARGVRASPLDGLVLSLDAGLRRGMPRNGWYGVISVGIPLDGSTGRDHRGIDADTAFDVGVRGAPSLDPSATSFLAEQPAGATDDAPAARAPVPDGDDAEPSQPAARAPSPSAELGGVKRAVRLAPAFVRRVVREALHARGLDSAEQRLESMQGRAKSSAVLPEVHLRAARTTGESLRLSPTADDPYRYLRGGDDQLIVEARLAWRLDRLVFADDELGIEKERRQDRAERAEWTLKVVTVLLRWHRCLLRAENTDLLPEERALAELEAYEAEATLDAMTGGWFGDAAGPAQ